jgi:hypothetical protein
MACGSAQSWRFWSVRRHEQWNITLLTAPSVMDREEIDWAAALPEDTVTGWLRPILKGRP